MNILLISPETRAWLWDFRHALHFIRKKPDYPPLGLLTVAALLPADWNKRLVDANMQELTQQDLEWADYVFISATSLQGASVHQITARCKQAGRKVVAGGSLFTYDWEKYGDVDHFLLNEAELTLPAFLADLEKGCARRVYARQEYPDLRQSPIPLWHLLNLNHYYMVSVQLSRGCPFDCDFCSVGDQLGRKIRNKTVPQIISELDSLYALGWRKDIYFVDDNFIGNIKELKTKILPALIAWRKGKKGLPFFTFASINLADDDELLHLMYEAGFDSVYIGIETPNKDSLTECNKYNNLAVSSSNHKNRDLIENVKRIHHAGIRVQGSFIVGFDSDTTSIFQQQIDFIQESGIVAAKVNQLGAAYGTRLYKRLEQEGRIRTLERETTEEESTNIIPMMGMEELQTGYKNLMLYIYSPRPYYERIKTFLGEFRRPKAIAPFEFQHILAFFRSIYHIGIKGIERVHYRRLLFWTLFHRPSLFSMAIALAIYGVHFRKHCERFQKKG